MLKRRTTLLTLPLALAGGLAQAQRERMPPLRRVFPDEDDLDFVWTDPTRRREIPLRLRLPAGTGPVPLVLFSHGLGGGLGAGRLWAQAWAAAGIATLHLQHAGSDLAVMRQGLKALTQAASPAQLRERVLDVKAVLDQLPQRQREDSRLQRLRLEALGMAGHSFGAHTTLALAGQRFRGQALGADDRLRAFAAFSPSPGQNDAAPAQSFGAINRPLLCLSGSLDGDPLGDGSNDARETRGDWRRAVYDALPAGDKAELWLDGADHMVFGGMDLQRLPPRLRQRPAAAVAQTARHQALIAAVTTDWWRAQLLGDAAARARLAQAPASLAAQDEWRRG